MRVTNYLGTKAGEPQPAMGTSQDPSRACECTHGSVEDLLFFVPSPVFGKDKGDPFITMSSRAAKAWLALFGHARRHGTWQPPHVDPLRPELSEGQRNTLMAFWTVNGLGHAMGVNRDTAGKALKELVQGGWVKIRTPRNKGQFGGIAYSFSVPMSVTQADKARVTEGLKKRGIEYRDYESRTAARVLEDHEIKRVQAAVELKIQEEKADLEGDEDKAVDLASQQVLGQRMGETKHHDSPNLTVVGFDEATENRASLERSGRC
jgi:hypothetical protein